MCIEETTYNDAYQPWVVRVSLRPGDKMVNYQYILAVPGNPTNVIFGSFFLIKTLLI
jgi:hypothetical protein